jgi:hypothetical protein
LILCNLARGDDNRGGVACQHRGIRVEFFQKICDFCGISPARMRSKSSVKHWSGVRRICEVDPGRSGSCEHPSKHQDWTRTLVEVKKDFPQFVAPMTASSVKEPFDSPDWIFETKLDGYRAIAVIGSNGKARHRPMSRYCRLINTGSDRSQIVERGKTPLRTANSGCG